MFRFPNHLSRLQNQSKIKFIITEDVKVYMLFLNVYNYAMYGDKDRKVIIYFINSHQIVTSKSPTGIKVVLQYPVKEQVADTVKDD